VGEDSRLARAGSGQDQQRTITMGDGFALGLVEALEERLGGGYGAH
jgi:hypothetical protein